MKLPWIFLFRFFLFTFLLLLPFGLLTDKVLAQAPPCNVASTSNCSTSTGSFTDYCPSGQVQCQGTNDSGGVCYTCAQTEGSGTCSLPGDDAKAPDGSDTTCGALYESSGVKCGEISGGVADCNVTDSKTGCKYCSTPICTEPGTFAFQGQCVKLATCETTVSDVGETTVQANSRITNDGHYQDYEQVNWYINNNLVGTTPMNGDGTGSNNISGLTPNTTYQAKAEYYDTDTTGTLQGISCSPASFTTFKPGSQMTCSLSVSPQSTNEGGSATWNISNTPAGATAWWGGANPDGTQVSGQVQGYLNATEWAGTYVYNTSGSYQRYVQIKNSSGVVQCTTDTVQLYVNSAQCRAFSISPSSLSFIPNGSGQTITASGADGNIITWSTTNSSTARLSQSSCTPTGSNKSCSVTVFPGTQAGTARITAQDPGKSSCFGENISIPVTVSSTSSTGNTCPGVCADSNGPTSSDIASSGQTCSGVWGYAGNTGWDSSCSQEKGYSSGYYCYTCSQTGGPQPPSPTPTDAPPVPFTTGSLYVKGPLLIGKIFQDIDTNFKIDGADSLIKKITSFITGFIQTPQNPRLQITGKIPNVLRGDPVYNLCINMPYQGLTEDERAVHQFILFPGEKSACTNKVYNPSVSVSLSATSDFIKIPNETTCDTADGCEYKGTSGNFTQTTTNAPNPVSGFYSKLSKNHIYHPGYGGSLTHEFTDTFSYIPGDVGQGSCVTGCTVKTKESRTFSTTQNSGPTGNERQCGAQPYNYEHDPRNKNPDGTCFVTRKSFLDEIWWELDPNQAYTRLYGNCQTGESSSYNWDYYKECSRYSFGDGTTTTPWSVNFTSPTISNDVSSENWYNLFDVPGEPQTCQYNPNTRQDEIIPQTLRPYCTCKADSWCDSDGSCTPMSSYDCMFPLKEGKSVQLAPPGDYHFEITVSGTGSVNYNISAGGSTLASGSGSVSGGKISADFNVPDSAVGQKINISVSQAGGGSETVTFGKPALYPSGWYESTIEFGRTVSTGLDDAYVVDPPADSPYTIGMVPPDNNYCDPSSDLSQCYRNLAQSELRYSIVNRVDFLLANFKSGAWFQVKDADLQLSGNLISKIPGVCATPTCDPRFELPGAGGYPGVPAYSGTADFGSGAVSTQGWLADSRYTGRVYNYQYFKNQVPSNAVKLNERFSVGGDGTLTLDNNDLVSLAEDETSYAVHNGSLVIEGNTNLANRKLVLFVDGSVTVKGRINLNAGNGFFGLFSGGSINIDPSVVSQNPNQYGLEGVFLANDSIHTGTNNPVPNSGTPDGQIYIRGSLAAWRGIFFERDLDPLKTTGDNNEKPAEVLEYAPDLMLNFPKEIFRRGQVWREVAP